GHHRRRPAHRLRRRRTGPHRVRVGGAEGKARPNEEEAREEGRIMSPEKNNFEFLEALQLVAREKGIAVETLLDAIANALVAAYKRMPNAAEQAVVTIDPDSMDFRVYAQELDEDGNVIREWDDTPDNFGRIAAQTAKQVITQRIREVERDQKYEEYAGREGDIVTGIIQQSDNRYTLLDLGKVEALLPQAEQVPYERYDQAALRDGGAGDQQRCRRDQGVRPGAGTPDEDCRLVQRCQRRPGRRVRRRPGVAGPYGHQRAAGGEGRHRALLRGPRRVRRPRSPARPGQGGPPGRRHRHGHRGRPRLPALAGHR